MTFEDYQITDERNMQMLSKHWFQHFTKCGRHFPRNYLAFDTETTGLSAGLDRIVQIGYCLVDGGKIIEKGGHYLDWTKTNLSQEWLEQRLDQVRGYIELKNGTPTGRKYNITIDKLMEQGEDPKKVLDYYWHMFKAQRDAKRILVAHNGYNFDEPMLTYHFRHILGKPFEFGPDDMLDTGVLEKASQVNIYPDPDESMRAFAGRVNRIRAKGVLWNLDRHCFDKYRLGSKVGKDTADACDAIADSVLCHHLLQAYYELALHEPDENSSF